MQLLLFFALLPFLLSLGVAAQAAGVYLAGLVPALYLWSQNQIRWRHREALRSVGAFLVCAWLVFPLGNLVNAVLPLGATASALPWPMDFTLRKLFESRLSSAFLISGVVALGIAALGRVRSVRTTSSSAVGLSARRLAWWFAAGLFLSTCLLGVYLVLQTTTGLELRSATGVLAEEHRSLGGYYRVFGFYGHPLSVAGVSLMWFSLAWMFFWGWVSEKSYGNNVFLKGFAEPAIPGSASLFPVFLVLASMGHLLFVGLSGGRTALLIAGALLVIVPNLVPLRGNLRMARWGLGIVGIPAAGAIAWAGGFLSRFSMLAEKMRSGAVADDRLSFWRTHLTIFRENLWLGQGHYWLENGVRKEYYAKMGFERLAEHKNFNAHNLFIECLADVGLVGSALLLVLAILFWRRLWKRSRNLPVSRLFFWGVALAFVANLFHGLTENTYFVSNIALPYLAVMWVFLWMTVVEERSGK